MKKTFSNERERTERLYELRDLSRSARGAKAAREIYSEIEAIFDDHNGAVEGGALGAYGRIEGDGIASWANICVAEMAKGANQARSLRDLKDALEAYQEFCDLAECEDDIHLDFTDLPVFRKGDFVGGTFSGDETHDMVQGSGAPDDRWQIEPRNSSGA